MSVFGDSALQEALRATKISAAFGARAEQIRLEHDMEFLHVV
jgi:hypothetical protein